MWAAWTNVLVRRPSPAKGLAGAPDEGGNDASALLADSSRRHRGAPRSGALRRRSTGTDPAESDLPAERRGHQAAAHGSLSRQALAALQRRDGHRSARIRRRGRLPALLRAPRRSARLARDAGPLRADRPAEREPLRDPPGRLRAAARARQLAPPHRLPRARAD